MASPATEKEFDLVVFGATGFTGQFVVEEVARVAKEQGGNLKWAVAGRSSEKLKSTLQKASTIVGDNLDQIPTIIADVKDVESLLQMCKRTKVVINCVGPYRFYGEPVVAACIAGKAHHVDISGEPQYLESVQLKYHEKAREAGVYIIGACGWDSIPTDMGVTLLKKKFDGELNSVETFADMTKSGAGGGASLHFGTWQSAIYGLAHQNELRPLRTQLTQEQYKKPYPKSKYPLKSRGLLSYLSDWPKGWCLPFPGSDKSVIRRTQMFNYEHFNERPVQANTYFLLPSFLYVIGIGIFAMIFGIMANFRIGRNLLEKYPRLFSFGIFSHEGPSREQLENATFTTYLLGRGWSEKLAEPTDSHSEPPNKTVKLVVHGPDAGYGATSIFLVHSAMVVLQESDKMPDNGGVLTTGTAFGNTSLIERLQQHRISFTFIE